METGRGLREMSPDPPGGPAIGTRVHEVVRSSGREYVADTVVTELDPGASYRFSGAGTIGGVAGGRAVRADEAGRLVRSGLSKDLARLRSLLEDVRRSRSPGRTRGARPGGVRS